jgi:hypothetical protein
MAREKTEETYMNMRKRIIHTKACSQKKKANKIHHR